MQKGCSALSYQIVRQNFVNSRAGQVPSLKNSRTNTRRYPERPIIGVGALILNRGRILLVKRGNKPLKGYWSLPGGVVEAGETLDHAIRREVLEETGLQVEPLGVLEIFERIIEDAKGVAEYHYVLIDYVCRVIAGTPCAGDDVSRVAWVKQSSLADYRITEGTVPVIEKAFRDRKKYAVQR